MVDCIEAWKGITITGSNGKHKLSELERLVENKSPTATPTTSPTQSPPRVAQPVPRVDDKSMRIKKSCQGKAREKHCRNLLINSLAQPLYQLCVQRWKPKQ